MGIADSITVSVPSIPSGVWTDGVCLHMHKSSNGQTKEEFSGAWHDNWGNFDYWMMRLAVEVGLWEKKGRLPVTMLQLRDRTYSSLEAAARLRVICKKKSDAKSAEKEGVHPTPGDTRWRNIMVIQDRKCSKSHYSAQGRFFLST